MNQRSKSKSQIQRKRRQYKLIKKVKNKSLLEAISLLKLMSKILFSIQQLRWACLAQYLHFKISYSTFQAQAAQKKEMKMTMIQKLMKIILVKMELVVMQVIRFLWLIENMRRHLDSLKLSVEHISNVSNKWSYILNAFKKN